MSRDSRAVEEALSASQAISAVDPLVTRAQRSDAEALDALVRAELPRVERLLLRMLGPRHDLADLVQTVFLELCRALPSFRHESSFSTFVGGITVQVARRALRPSAWWSRRSEMPDAVRTPGPSPEQALELSDRLRRCERALGALTAEKRVAFTLWAFEGLEVAAVAELTGASVSATRSRIFYAQKELRKRAASDPWLRDLLGADDDRG